MKELYPASASTVARSIGRFSARNAAQMPILTLLGETTKLAIHDHPWIISF